MPRRRSFRRRGGFRRARSFIRRTVVNMGPIERKAIILKNISVAASTTGDVYDGTPTNIDLIVAQESVDEEVVSDGSTVAQTRPYSKIVGMKFDLTIHNLGTAEQIRWMLVKKQDGEDIIATTGLTDGHFHSTLDTQNYRELRRLTLAKGYIIANAASLKGQLKIFVKRKTLRRLGSLRENDRLCLYIQGNETTMSADISGIGTIYVRTN